MAGTSRRRHNESSFGRGYANIAGVSEAVRNLRMKGEHVLTAAKQALKEGADMIVQDAKSRCPVKTGALKNSITAKSLEDGAAYELSADAKNKRGIAYGQFVEFDPRIAHPFLYPALDANVDRVKQRVGNAIQTAIGQ